MSRPDTPPPFKPPLLDDPDEDPVWSWYYGADAGGHILEFGKYKNRELKLYEARLRYLAFTRKHCSASRRDFIEAFDRYSAGLEAGIEEHYGRFVVPFGKKHRGKTIQECRDKPWLLWTQQQRYLTERHPIYFSAVQQWLDHTKQHLAVREVGQLCHPHDYEADMAGYKTYVLSQLVEETPSDEEFIVSSQTEDTQNESQDSLDEADAAAEKVWARMEAEEQSQEPRLYQSRKRRAYATPTPTSSQEPGSQVLPSQSSKNPKRARMSSSESLPLGDKE